MTGQEAQALAGVAEGLRTLGIVGGGAFALLVIWIVYKIICAILKTKEDRKAHVGEAQPGNGSRGRCAYLETNVVARDRIARTEAIVTRSAETMVRLASSNERQEAILKQMLDALLHGGAAR